MEQFSQGNEPIEKKPEEVPIQEDIGNNQEKFKISDDVRPGTAKMVGYELRNSILRTEELLKKDPDNEAEKKRLEDYKLQEAILDAPVINIERRKRINEENPEEFSEKQLQETTKNFSAIDTSYLVEEHFISRFLKTKREKGLVDDLDEYQSNLPKTDIEKLLKAAKALEHRLVSEDIRADNKAMDEANKKTEREKEMEDVRQKIKDVNPNETQKFDTAGATPLNEKSSEREKTKEKVIENVLKGGGFKAITSFEDIVAKGQKNYGQQAIFERMKNKEFRSYTMSVIESHISSQEECNKKRSLHKIMRERKMKEVVDIRHAEEPIYETVTTKKGRKGLFGIGKTSDKKSQEFTGKMKKMMHNELVEDGKDEPAIKITYLVEDENWKSGNRKGQGLNLEIVIPESIAEEVKQEIETNPIFIRNLSEKIMKEKILLNPKEWEKKHDVGGDALRPNYEKLDKEEGGGRIYVQSEGDPRGWNENSVKKITF